MFSTDALERWRQQLYGLVPGLPGHQHSQHSHRPSAHCGAHSHDVESSNGSRRESADHISFCKSNTVGRSLILPIFKFADIHGRVPIMLIPQTVYWAKHTGSRDQTWTLVEPSIWGQIAMNLSILTACVPSLKGVIDMFWSGASMFTVPGQYNPSSLSSGPGGIRSLVPSRFRTFTTGSQNRANNSNLKSREQRSNEHLGSTACDQQPDTILERSESQTRLTDNNIVRTVEYQVSSEPIDRTLNPRAAGSDGVSQTSF